MSEKITWPTFGPQSMTVVLRELNQFESMPFDVKYTLANQLMTKFKELRFRVTFDERTGKIESFKLIDEDALHNRQRIRRSLCGNGRPHVSWVLGISRRIPTRHGYADVANRCGYFTCYSHSYFTGEEQTSCQSNFP